MPGPDGAVTLADSVALVVPLIDMGIAAAPLTRTSAETTPVASLAESVTVTERPGPTVDGEARGVPTAGGVLSIVTAVLAETSDAGPVTPRSVIALALRVSNNAPSAHPETPTVNVAPDAADGVTTHGVAPVDAAPEAANDALDSPETGPANASW